MNYLSIYNTIVERALSENRRKRKYDDPKYVYYERHHIIPKCIGGTNDGNNLILLTAKEHYVAHQLLVKIYPGIHKLVFALRMMCRSNKYHVRNNKEFEWIKKLNAIATSESQKGKSYGHKFSKGNTTTQGSMNGMFGKTHSDETRLKQSIKAKDRSVDNYKGPKSESHKANIKKSKQLRKYKLISPENIEYIFDNVKEASDFCKISTSVLIKLAGNRYMFDHCREWKCIAILH
jgi:hypothetical protein